MLCKVAEPPHSQQPDFWGAVLAAVGGAAALRELIAFVSRKFRERLERLDGMEQRAEQRVVQLETELEAERERATAALAAERQQCIQELAEVRAKLAQLEGEMKVTQRLHALEVQVEEWRRSS